MSQGLGAVDFYSWLPAPKPCADLYISLINPFLSPLYPFHLSISLLLPFFLSLYFSLSSGVSNGRFRPYYSQYLHVARKYLQYIKILKQVNNKSCNLETCKACTVKKQPRLMQCVWLACLLNTFYVIEKVVLAQTKL